MAVRTCPRQCPTRCGSSLFSTFTSSAGRSRSYRSRRRARATARPRSCSRRSQTPTVSHERAADRPRRRRLASAREPTRRHPRGDRGPPAGLPAGADHAWPSAAPRPARARSSPPPPGVNSAKLRKDLSYLGSYGTRGVGYDVEYLRYQIAREIGLTQDWPVVIVGIGNLGHALANYSGFRSPRLPHRRAARRRPGAARRGRRRARRSAASTTSSRSSREHGVAIGVIATPAVAAQDVCRPDGRGRRHAASSTSRRPCSSVPDGVDVRKVDLSIELQILAYHEQRKARAERDGARSRRSPA